MSCGKAVLYRGLAWVFVNAGVVLGGSSVASIPESKTSVALTSSCPQQADASVGVSALEAAAAACEQQHLYTRAATMLEAAIRLREAEGRADSQALIVSLGALGYLHEVLGNLPQAQRTYERALALEAAGAESGASSVAILTHLARIYELQGKDAAPLYDHALADAERLRGADSASVARILNNYALFEKQRGRLEQANELGERALAVRERVSGPKDPETATVLNNLGQIAVLRGDRSRARALFHRAIHTWETSLGPGHPNVARALSNLATLESVAKKFSEAERLYRRALEIDRAYYGNNHPNTARDLNNLAVLYYRTGRYAESEPLLLEALQIDRSAAVDPVEVLRVLANLADVRRLSGDEKSAESLYREALTMWKARADTNNPELLPAMTGLITLLRSSERYAEAEKLEASVMRIRVKRALLAETK